MVERRAIQDVVVAKTKGELGSFLDEVARGTSKYQTIHNLTEQIEHQYAGRFAIELIQNAHDPIFAEPGWGRGEQRIELLLDAAGAHGTLLVANDGRPFRAQDFKALSNLGQSSKNPKEAIGNKGIGFRSVLEVSKCPEVYSCRIGAPGAFDGYCLKFDPAVLGSFEDVVEQVLSGADAPLWHYEGVARSIEAVRGDSIRDWARDGLDVSGEVRYLSPYSLPLPIEARDPSVLDFARRGFATVVRLPLTDAKARDKVEKALAELREDTILFLPRVRSLVVRIATESRSYYRHEDQPVGQLQRQNVAIRTGESTAEPRKFWLWRRTYGAVPEGAPADSTGHAEAQRLAKAVEKLPGNWKELREAEIAIAVERKSDPSPGSLFIHLPTQLSTGVGAHLHAPFYGDMSRKTIDFAEEELNQVLLDALADHAYRILSKDLIGGGPEEGAAALDITVRQVDGDGSSRWRAALREKGALRLSLYHTDRGWCDASAVRVLGARLGSTILTRETLRAHAAFPALSEPLAQREALASAQIRESLGPADPTPYDRELTVEAVATALHARGGADWNAFLGEVRRWVSSAHDIERVRILPDEKGVLRAAEAGGSGPQLFLPPVRGEGASEIVDVPLSLASRVAFLSPGIEVRQPGQQFRLNDLGEWLQEIVEPYSAEPILSRVLEPALPDRAAKLTATEERLCRDVLGWAVQLVERAGGEATLLPALRKLRVPCRGGWFRMEEAIAGPGWTELGELLDQSLGAMSTPETNAVLDRILVPKDDEAWAGAARFVLARLSALGIMDGLLPIEPVRPWSCNFAMTIDIPVALPECPPPGASAEQWQAYAIYARGAFEPGYQGTQHRYELLGTRVLPGLDVIDGQIPEVRRRYAELIVRSMPAWPEGWREVRCHKVRGSSPPSVRSLLAHTLVEWPWIWVDDEESQQGGEAQRPKDLWYVSQLRTHNRYYYAHLNPLPPALCRAVDEAGAGAALATVGLRRCPIDDETEPVRTPDPALLDALAVALDQGRVSSGAKAIFIGQVRKAWKWFDVGPTTPLPARLIVFQGGRPRTIKTGAADVYLPVGGTSGGLLGLDGELPVLCIEPKDAEQLAPLLTARHPETMLPLNSLQFEVQVDNQPWSPSDASLPLSESALQWLAPVALAVSAFGGQGRGTTAKTFRQAVAAVRAARAEATPKLSVRLSRRGQVGAPVERWAHLDQGSTAQGHPSTLLYDPAWPKGYAELARPVQALLDRYDLRSDLLVVLGRLDGAGAAPEREAWLSALAALDIDESRVQEVELALLGDLEATIRRLRPVVHLLAGPSAAARLARAQKLEDVEEVLEGIHPGLTPDALTEAARIASSDLEMGLWLHRALGAMAELDRWNAALESLGGDYRPIANGKSLREELEEYRRDLRVPLRALARALAVDGTDYECLHDELERVKLPDALEAVRWTLSFRDAVSIVLGPLESRIVSDLAVALRDASETTGFVSVLQRSGLGVDPLIDPAQVHGENDRLCARLIDDVARTAIVWCGRVQLSAGGWADVESLKGSVAARVRSGQGFLQRFDEPKAFAEVRAGVPRGTSLVADGPYAPLWQALDAAASVAELLVGLGLATGDLEGASEILLRQEEVARRKKRLLPIAGGEFDTAAENLGALFDHIRNGSAIPEALDMMAVSQLASVAARRRDSPSGRGGTPPRGRGRRYASQELKNAIALAGEIRAYRWLLATYGPAVGPDCWLSSLGVHAFPANTSDDGAGCDFRLKIPDSKFTLHLEVKATPGEEEAFELGSSEIELAREVLSSRRRKKDLFRILHVLDVFSPTPTPVLLPNPYDPNQRVFRIDEGGVRMRYRRAQPAPGTVEPT